MPSNNFKPSTVLICDDIRREDNGKIMLIGIYMGDIVVPKPMTLPLSFLLIGKTSGNKISFTVRIEFQEEDAEKTKKYDQSIEEKSSVEFENAEISMALAGVPVEINTSGVLNIRIRNQSGGKWQNIVTKKVTMTSPTEP